MNKIRNYLKESKSNILQINKYLSKYKYQYILIKYNVQLNNIII